MRHSFPRKVTIVELNAAGLVPDQAALLVYKPEHGEYYHSVCHKKGGLTASLRGTSEEEFS